MCDESTPGGCSKCLTKSCWSYWFTNQTFIPGEPTLGSLLMWSWLFGEIQYSVKRLRLGCMPEGARTREHATQSSHFSWVLYNKWIHKKMHHCSTFTFLISHFLANNVWKLNTKSPHWIPVPLPSRMICMMSPMRQSCRRWRRKNIPGHRQARIIWNSGIIELLSSCGRALKAFLIGHCFELYFIANKIRVESSNIPYRYGSNIWQWMWRQWRQPKWMPMSRRWLQLLLWKR